MKRILSIGVLVASLVLVNPIMADEKIVDCKEEANRLLQIIERDMEPKKIYWIKFSPSLNMTDEFYQCVAEKIEESTGNRYSLEKISDGSSASHYVLEKRRFYRKYGDK